MLKVGITGGIGTGKTLVSKIFNALGVPIYDADSRAKWVMENDQELVSKIKSLLGSASYKEKNTPDTRFIAAAVFGNEPLLQQLNGLVHPAVAHDFELWTSKQEGAYVLKEAALLFESGSYKTLDFLITVSAPIDIRLDRIARRDPFRTREQILAIISRQLPEEDKIAKSNVVVNNDGSTLVIPQVLKIHSGLCGKKTNQ